MTEPLANQLIVDMAFAVGGIVTSIVGLTITMILFDLMDWALNRFGVAPIPDAYRAPYMLLPSRSAKSNAADE